MIEEKAKEEKIQKEYIDTDHRLTLLAQLIPQSQMLKDAKIWIDEFDSFTPQELSIIEALEKKAHLTVTLTMDRAGLLTQGQNRDGQRCVSIIPLPLNRPLRVT